MGKAALTLAALLALSSGAYAIERPTISPQWQNSFGEASARGSVIEQTGPNTFDRIVRDQSQCDKGEELTPTFSGNSAHFLGYTCENEYDN